MATSSAPDSSCRFVELVADRFDVRAADLLQPRMMKTTSDGAIAPGDCCDGSAATEDFKAEPSEMRGLKTGRIATDAVRRINVRRSIFIKTRSSVRQLIIQGGNGRLLKRRS
jgi:hypothetical protein